MKKIIFKIKLIFIPCEENHYRPGILQSNFLPFLLLFLFFLKFIIIPFLIYFPNANLFADVSKAVLIELTNKERQELGLNLLKENSKLNQAALLKAQDILTYDYFAHQSPQGKTPWHWIKKANYNYQTAGENLGIGFLDSTEVHQEWNNSPSHKANLLNPKYQEIGIAIVKGNFQGNDATIVVQLFGKEKPINIGKEELRIKNQELSKAKEELSIKNQEATVNKEKEESRIKNQELSKEKEESRIKNQELSKEKEELRIKNQQTTINIEKEELSIKNQETTDSNGEEELINSQQLTDNNEKENKGNEKIQEQKIIQPVVAGIQIQENIEESQFLFNLLKFISLKYSNLTQKVTLFSLFFIILAFLINVLVHIKIQQRDLICKTIFCILLLVAFVFIDKDFIFQIIPHDFKIT